MRSAGEELSDARMKPSNVISIRDLYIRSEAIFNTLREEPSRTFVVTYGGNRRREAQSVAVLLSRDEYERLRRYQQAEAAYLEELDEYRADFKESPPL